MGVFSAVFPEFSSHLYIGSFLIGILAEASGEVKKIKPHDLIHRVSERSTSPGTWKDEIGHLHQRQSIFCSSWKLLSVYLYHWADRGDHGKHFSVICLGSVCFWLLLFVAFYPGMTSRANGGFWLQNTLRCYCSQSMVFLVPVPLALQVRVSEDKGTNHNMDK